MRRFFGLAVLFLTLTGISQSQAAHSNTITWAASTSTVSGYNVYRFAGACAGTPLASFTRLTATPITVLTYTDSGMADGAVNCYYVTAVGTDAAKTESQSSGTLQLTSPIFTANVAPTPTGRPSSSSQ
jgi:hypothetical protein